MMRRAMTKSNPVTSESAAAPKIELMPSQPMQLSQLSSPGTMMLLP